ncbi:MAG: bifunctional diguanylate cyclase/phosphodiesterase [Aeromonadaceae bacterium]
MSWFSLFFQRKLAVRATMLFAGALLIIMGGGMALLTVIYLHAIDEIEDEQIKQANNQAQHALQLSLSEMTRRSEDWSSWDETYHLLIQGDPDFKQRNLTPATLLSNDVDLMIFLDRTGHYREGAQLSQDHSQSSAPSPDLLAQLLGPNGVTPMLQARVKEPETVLSALSGLLTLQNIPHLISMTPVLTSTQQGPVAGWMIWGRRLPDFFPARYQPMLPAETRLLLPGDPTIPSTVPTMLAQAIDEVVLQYQPKRLLAYSQIRDLHQAEIALLSVQAPRALHQGGLLSIQIWLMASLVLGSLLLVCFYRLFHNQVSGRFTLLERGLTQVRQAQHLTPFPLPGQDEIAQVSHIIAQLQYSRRLSEQAHQEMEQQFSALFEGASVGMALLIDERLQSINQPLVHLLGYDYPSQLEGQHWSTLFSSQNEQDPFSLTHFKECMGQNSDAFEWEFVGRAGWRVPCEVNLIPLASNQQTGWLIAARDITERKNNEHTIYRLSHYDALTGLLNRHQLLTQINGYLASRDQQLDAPFALLHLDLAHFKLINETFGHAMGDVLLQLIAERLSHHFTEPWLARIAGDEFVLFLPHMEHGLQPLRMAKECLQLIANSAHLQQTELSVCCTIGIVIGSIPFHSAEEILQAADFTLNRAKQRHRPIALFTRRLQQESMRLTLIKRDLPQAIRNNQLQLFFQPIVDVTSQQIVAMEALARWPHPDVGFIPPAQFIPFAEESQLIIELGLWVLQQASALGANLNKERQVLGLPPLQIHVNLSARHLSSHTLLPTLQQILQESGMQPEQLCIEITESMLLEQPREAVQRMHRIKQLGINLALDDFGTGYSALNTLCHYPLDVVKLDRSFVLRLMEGRQGELLVRAIINMAHDLELDIVAEGVETGQQQQKLAALGIREIQGYFYHAPMPASALFALCLPQESAANAMSSTKQP